MTKKYVFTGSSYSGKTTIINTLTEHGFATVPEAASLIISEQLEQGGDVLPWERLDLFLDALITKQLKLEAKIPAGSKIAFIDRGIPDEFAYFKYMGTEPTPLYAKAFQEHRYDKVFVFDPVPGYRQDQIRIEPPEMVRRLRILHEEAYRELGYNVTIVPFMPIAERVRFIIDRI